MQRDGLERRARRRQAVPAVLCRRLRENGTTAAQVICCLTITVSAATFYYRSVADVVLANAQVYAYTCSL